MDNLFLVIAVGGGCLIPIIAIIAGNTRATRERRQIEESRRELAAYVAEGSMTPDDAARLLDAGPKPARD